MIFDLPSKTGFVVYSKTDCIFCSKVKMLLNDCNLDFKEIKCDKYILDNKTSFFSFMSEISMTQINTFPVVFYNNNLVGGYNETSRFVEKLQLKFDRF